MIDSRETKKLTNDQDINLITAGINRIRFLKNKEQSLYSNIDRLTSPQHILSHNQIQPSFDTNLNNSKNILKLLNSRRLIVDEIIIKNKENAKVDKNKQVGQLIEKKQKWKKQIGRYQLEVDGHNKLLRNRVIRNREKTRDIVNRYRSVLIKTGCDQRQKIRQMCSKQFQNRQHSKQKQIEKIETQLAFAENLKEALLNKIKKDHQKAEYHID